jgi:hypothetical protein
MTINVSWDDIRLGKRRSTTECMLALALKRELGIDYVSVGLCDIRLRTDGSYLTLHLPTEIGRKIRFWELFHFTLPFRFDFPGLAIGLGRQTVVRPAVKTTLAESVRVSQPVLSAI